MENMFHKEKSVPQRISFQFSVTVSTAVKNTAFYVCRHNIKFRKVILRKYSLFTDFSGE